MALDLKPGDIFINLVDREIGQITHIDSFYNYKKVWAEGNIVCRFAPGSKFHLACQYYSDELKGQLL